MNQPHLERILAVFADRYNGHRPRAVARASAGVSSGRSLSGDRIGTTVCVGSAALRVAAAGTA